MSKSTRVTSAFLTTIFQIEVPYRISVEWSGFRYGVSILKIVAVSFFFERQLFLRTNSKFQTLLTLTSHNSCSKHRSMEKHNIFWIVRTSTFTWYSPYRVYEIRMSRKLDHSEEIIFVLWTVISDASPLQEAPITPHCNVWESSHIWKGKVLSNYWGTLGKEKPPSGAINTIQLSWSYHVRSALWCGWVNLIREKQWDGNPRTYLLQYVAK